MDDPVCKSEPSCLSFEEDQNLGCCLPGIQILHLVSVPSKFSFKCLSENTLVVSNFLMLTSVAGVQKEQINWRLSQIWPNVFLRYDFLIFMNYLTMQRNFFWNVFQIRRALSKYWQILPYFPVTYYVHIWLAQGLSQFLEVPSLYRRHFGDAESSNWKWQ